MDPRDILTWERLLQSDVAVALLLLAAVLVLGGILFRWTRALYRENRQLRRELIDELRAALDLRRRAQRIDAQLERLEREERGHVDRAE